MKPGKHLGRSFRRWEEKGCLSVFTVSRKGQQGGNLLWFVGLLHSLTWQMQNMTRGAGAAPMCCGDEALSRSQVNSVLFCSLINSGWLSPLGSYTWNLGSRDKGDLKLKNAPRKWNQSQRISWQKSFKALWHVLEAKPLSSLAFTARAMPPRCFTLQ